MVDGGHGASWSGSNKTCFPPIKINSVLEYYLCLSVFSAGVGGSFYTIMVLINHHYNFFSVVLKCIFANSMGSKHGKGGSELSNMGLLHTGMREYLCCVPFASHVRRKSTRRISKHWKIVIYGTKAEALSIITWEVHLQSSSLISSSSCNQ